MPRAGRTALIVAGLIAAAVVAFLLLRPGGEDDPSSGTPPASTTTSATTTAARTATTPHPPEPVPVVRVRAGRPVGGVTAISVRSGDTVRFVVSSDVDEEVHVHGYDLSAPVGPGSPARFGFPARLEGVWEVELEGSAVPIIRLTVRP